MKCAYRERLLELLDAAPNADAGALREHLEICPACAAEYSQMRQTLTGLEPARAMTASPYLKEQIMTEIQQAIPQQANARRPWWRVMKPLVAATAAVVVLVGISFATWLTQTNGNEPISAFAVLGQAAHAMTNLRTVHIEAQMRTPPADCFDTISLDCEPMPIELWKEFGDPPRWRAEKPGERGRIVVMDGEKSTLWIPSQRHAAAGMVTSGFVQWLLPLMDTDTLLQHEVELAQEQGSNLLLTHESGETGVDELLLRIESCAQGDFSESDYTRNSSITESDNLRIYRFDSQTKRMIGLQVYVHTPDEDVLVFETTRIIYDQPIAPDLFALNIPEDADWSQEPQTPGAVPEASTPDGLARAFFEACAAEDWATAAKYRSSPVPDVIRNFIGGAQLLKLGKPFKSGLYPGYFVPYEIRLKSGQIYKSNLTVRNDNPAGQFVQDGGI